MVQYNKMLNDPMFRFKTSNKNNNLLKKAKTLQINSKTQLMLNLQPSWINKLKIKMMSCNNFLTNNNNNKISIINSKAILAIKVDNLCSSNNNLKSQCNRYKVRKMEMVLSSNNSKMNSKPNQILSKSKW